MGRWPLDLLLCEESVVGGDDLSNHELSVEVDLFCGFSLTSPLVLEFPDEPAVSVSVFTDIFERLRRLRSLRNEGITTDEVDERRWRRYAIIF